MERIDGPVQKNESIEFTPALSLGINKEKLDVLLLSCDETEEKLVELFLALPHKLDIKPGVTLVVGENGSGKSVIAKAIHCAVDLEATKRSLIANGEYTNSDDFYTYYSPKNIPKLIVDISRCIEVNQAEVPAVIYHNYTTSSGVAESGYGSVVNIHSQKLSGRERASRHSEAVGLSNFDGSLFLDEPEVTMDVKRSAAIMSYLNEMADVGEGRAVIAPTNALHALISDAARIDTSFPERGVFTPREFPGYLDKYIDVLEQALLEARNNNQV